MYQLIGESGELLLITLAQNRVFGEKIGLSKKNLIQTNQHFLGGQVTVNFFTEYSKNFIFLLFYFVLIHT